MPAKIRRKARAATRPQPPPASVPRLLTWGRASAIVQWFVARRIAAPPDYYGEEV